MDAETRIGTETTESLREQIDSTRHALGDKLQSLEGEMRGVFENVSHSVSDRVTSVRRVVDISERIRRYPKVACVGALALGIVMGRRGTLRERLVSRRGAGRGESLTSRVQGELVRASIPFALGIFQDFGSRLFNRWVSSREPREEPASPTIH